MAPIKTEEHLRMDDPVLGVIDVGTNAIRLKLASLLPDGSFDTLHQARDPVRPGEGVFQTGVMQPAVVDRLVSALVDYGALCRRYKAKVRAVATSALREAKNCDAVLARVKKEAGLDLEVVSGKEEARLICLGVLRGMPAGARSLLVDIGGGSTEVARAVGEEPSELWSIPIGAVRLTEIFEAGGRVTREQLVMMRRFTQRSVQETLGPVLLATGKRATVPQNALGSSGTIRAIVAFAARPGTAHATRDDLSRAVEELALLGPEVRRKRFDAQRADIIVAGAVILESVAHHLRLHSVTAVDGGLKEGLLVDLVRRMQPRSHDPMLTEALLTAGQRLHFDEPHALFVAKIALKLYDDLALLHRLPPEARMILETGATLHDVGGVINRTRHHRHSMYLIANMDLPGLSDHERELASLVARFHRRSVPAAKHPALAHLPPVEVRTVRKLATLLRLADACDRSRAQAVDGVDAIVKRQAVLLKIHPRKKADLEAWDAEHDVALFGAVFGKRLEIVVTKT